MKLGALLCLVVVLAVACGSTSNQLYSLQKTRACLVAKHTRIEGLGGDFVASTATGGAFKAKLGQNAVTVAFGASLSDADNIYQAYQHFHARNVGINDVLRQQQNAVMLWHAHPSNTDLALVTGCLK